MKRLQATLLTLTLVITVPAVGVGSVPQQKDAAQDLPTKNQVLSLRKEAKSLQAQGRNAEAATQCERALAEVPRLWGEGGAEHAVALTDLGLLYTRLARYAQAEPLYKRALAINEAKLGPDHLSTAASLNNLALLYHATSRYAEAEPLYKRALAIRKAKLGPDHADTGQALNNLGGMYETVGRYAEAEPMLRSALAIREARLGPDHPDTARTFNNLGWLYIVVGRYAEAEPMLRSALAIREARLGPDHPDTGQTLNNLGGLYYRTSRYAEAEPLYKRALEIRRAKLGPDHPDTGQAIYNLGGLYSAVGRYSEAEPMFRSALAIREARLGPDHPDTARTFKTLGSLYAAMGRFPEAFDAFDDARKRTRRHASRILPALGMREQLAFTAIDRGPRGMCLSLALRHALRSADVERSAMWLLNAKGAAEEALAQSSIAARDARDPTFAPLVTQLQDLRRRLAQATLGTVSVGEEVAQRREREELSRKEEEVAQRLRLVGGAVGARDPWVDLDVLRRSLPKGGVLVDLARFQTYDFKAANVNAWGPAHYAAWITPKSGPVKVVDLGAAEAIDTAVAAARKTLEEAPNNLLTLGEPAADAEARRALAVLAKLVLEPLRPYLDAHETWVVSPDAQLWVVPWAALPLDEQSYAIEKHSIQLVLSGRDLIPKSVRPTSASGPAIFADPDFDAAPGSTPAAKLEGGETRSLEFLKFTKVVRLPGTVAEADAVAARLNEILGIRPAVYTDRAATTSAFASLNRPKVLTMSTHGFFLPTQDLTVQEKERLARDADYKPATWIEDPLLRCGLLLAGCNTPTKADTGVVTGREVLSTDLRGCKLVVLSACETGLGDVRTGEGVAGLRQAFMLAGAESVLATLWKVPDRDTALLVTDVFAELGKGSGKAEALRQAQLQRIDERRKRFGAAHPFFWAALTLTGADGGIADSAASEHQRRPETTLASRTNQTYAKAATMDPAPAPRPAQSIVDAAGFFKPESVASAQRTISAIKASSGKDVVVETFASVPDADRVRFNQLVDRAEQDKFFAEWADKRASELKVTGVYLLVCRKPGKFYVMSKGGVIGRDTIDRARERLLESLRKGDLDGGLAALLETIRDDLGAQAPRPR
jgi:CHAT domain-containing protein/Tfp pilus assembly protein PilF